MSSVPLLRWGIENSDAEALHTAAEKGEAKQFVPNSKHIGLTSDDRIQS
jgi:hypothetical protein